MVCTCSLVEWLDLLPMAMLLMIEGKIRSLRFVGHLPGTAKPQKGRKLFLTST